MATELYMIGNAHLDPAWMWRLGEGFEAFLATCRSALDRMAETPDFIFTASSAAHYEYVEQTDPELFVRIQDAVKQGRWSIVGGWWIEPDCNLPGGETFIRHGLYAQASFMSRFDLRSTTGFCIDSFGHNANIPQLLRHCAMDSYIFMRPDQDEKAMTDSLFEWRSASGDAILAYRIPLHYSNFKQSVHEKLEALPSYPLFKKSQPWMIFYGVGNHGGGPTKQQIAEIIQSQSEKPEYEIKFSSPQTFFDTIRKSGIQVPQLAGEMQPHAIGCYSAHSEIKRLARQSEHLLLRSEKVSILAEARVPAFKANWESFHQAWKNILLNSFHDILGGVAIKEACDEAISMYHEALAIAGRAQRVAVQSVANSIDTSDSVENLIVMNPHPWRVTTPIEFELWNPEASEQGSVVEGVLLTNEKGEQLEIQKIEPSGKIGEDRARFTGQVTVPGFAARKWRLSRQAQKKKTKSAFKASEQMLSNGICGIMFEGEAAEGSIKYFPAQAFADTSDTWGHGINGFTDQKGFFKVNRVVVIERGPVRGRVRVESSYGNSRMEEDFILYAGADTIEHRVYLDWRKTDFVLKLRYEHGCLRPSVVYETPYSIIERTISEKEVPGGAWVFLQDEERGLGIINDGKSSYSSDERFLYVTAARSPLFAHHSPPHQNLQNERKRYLDQGEQEFTCRIVFGKRSWRAAEMPKRSLEFLQRPIAHLESAHPGAPVQGSITLDVSAPNIIVTVLKRSLDGKGIIIRALESVGDESQVFFTAPIFLVNWQAHFRPHELKTFLIADGKVIETNGLEDAA